MHENFVPKSFFDRLFFFSLAARGHVSKMVSPKVAERREGGSSEVMTKAGPAKSKMAAISFLSAEPRVIIGPIFNHGRKKG